LRRSGIVVAGGILLVLAMAVWLLARASLPRPSGEAQVAGLAAAVVVELDAHAVPRIRASTLEDAFRAQGFMHAQERFFQMDLMRRSAAGELAALAGEQALPLDRTSRPFDLRRRAREVVTALPQRHRGWVDAYVEGVAAGLADLDARPPEYWLLGERPAPWTAEDTVLVVFALYTLLSNNQDFELPQGVMHATLPASVYEFLTPATSRFDSPLVAFGSADPTGGYVPLAIPPPEVLDLRLLPPVDGTAQPPAGGSAPRVDPPLTGPGSNQWAVSAARGPGGGLALLANDPHLEIQVPNVFYRAELEWPGGAARGVSVPGVPGILLGASDTVAWGATVSYADQSDWVVVERDPADPTRYRTPEGYEPFAAVRHEIAVHGGEAATIEVLVTRWGPVLAEDWLGRPLAQQSTWLAPGGLNLALLEIVEARDVDAALAVLERWAGPSLNWALADSSGHVAWTFNGPVPRRIGFDGTRPQSRADGVTAWDGELPEPQLAGAGLDTVFTANNRTLAADDAAAYGSMWMRPLRAQRIAELLAGAATVTERTSLDMQLDAQAAAYEALQALVLEAVPEVEQDAALARARDHVRNWSGRAEAEEPGFRILHLYYRALLERVLGPLLAAPAAADPAFALEQTRLRPTLGRWRRRHRRAHH
jgi:penicillin amidase